MKKHSLLITVIATSLSLMASVGVRNAKAEPPPQEAKIVSPEEAAKKYPPANGKKYPPGMDAQLANDIGSAAHSGFIKSPYSPRVYDCRKVGSGTLILDESVNKVFVRP
jgi:hypothetical protein